MSELLKDILDRINAPAEEKKTDGNPASTMNRESKLHYSEDFWKKYGKKDTAT